MLKKNLPIGTSLFRDLLDPENNYAFADKSLFIKKVLNDRNKVNLIIRPRRWGKTLNLSMLEHFFAPEVYGFKTKGLFDHLKIAEEEQGRYMEYQGQYLVINVTLKEIKARNFEIALSSIKAVIADLYRKFVNPLMGSEKLNEYDKNTIDQYAKGEVEESALAKALFFLSKCLSQHYERKVYILLDEYDTPINSAYGNTAYFEPMVLFMKTFLGSTFKDNPYLEKGIMTGILRVSKENMLSGLNNLNVHSMLTDTTYEEDFGFTETEITELFKACHLSQVVSQDIRAWYNGYQTNQTVLYNPWSIVNCLQNQGEFRTYWVNTADDQLIRKTLLASDATTKASFQALMEGRSILAILSENVRFEDLSIRDNSLWSMLFSTGYLTYAEKHLLERGTGYRCQLRIPNREILGLYQDVFAAWLEASYGYEYHSFLEDLLEGRVESFAKKLQNYLLTHTSQFDFSDESNYHTFFLGLICGITETHILYSNVESGLGRPDVMLIPKDHRKHLAIILEFKHFRMTQNDRFEELAKAGLAQIELQHYSAAIKQYPHVHHILKVGLAFAKKRVALAYRRTDLAHPEISKEPTLCIYDLD